MAYRFKLEEGFGKGLVRIGEEQLERARTGLESAPPGIAVHETRKCMKRLRAALRLVRAGIGEPAFRRENGRLRDLARLLSASRDRDVLSSTAERLAAEGRITGAALGRLKTGIAALSNDADRHPGKLVEQALALVDDALDHWRDLKLEPDDIAPVAEGLAIGQRRLRAALEDARSGEDEAVHDWRKAIQQHWRHMRLMQAGWPAYFEARATEARAVSELLGVAQDLTLLLAHVQGAAGEGLTAKQAKAVVSAAEEQRRQLREAAETLSLRLVADGPGGLARRCCSYWVAALRARTCGEALSAHVGSDGEKPVRAVERKPVARTMATRGPRPRASRGKR